MQSTEKRPLEEKGKEESAAERLKVLEDRFVAVESLAKQLFAEIQLLRGELKQPLNPALHLAAIEAADEKLAWMWIDTIKHRLARITPSIDDSEPLRRWTCMMENVAIYNDLPHREVRLVSDSVVKTIRKHIEVADDKGRYELEVVNAALVSVTLIPKTAAEEKVDEMLVKSWVATIVERQLKLRFAQSYTACTETYGPEDVYFYLHSVGSKPTEAQLAPLAIKSDAIVARIRKELEATTWLKDVKLTRADAGVRFSCA